MIVSQTLLIQPPPFLPEVNQLTGQCAKEASTRQGPQHPPLWGLWVRSCAQAFAEWKRVCASQVTAIHWVNSKLTACLLTLSIVQCMFSNQDREMSSALQRGKVLNYTPKCTHHTKEAQSWLARVALEGQHLALTTPRTKAGTQEAAAAPGVASVRPSIHARVWNFPVTENHAGSRGRCTIKEHSGTFHCLLSGAREAVFLAGFNIQAK